MQLLHKTLEEKIKKAERLPKSTPTDLSNIYTKDEIDQKISEIPIGGVEEAPIDTKQYGRKDAGWTEITASGHTQNTDTGLGTLGTKNPPVDGDTVVQRNSETEPVGGLVTSTWTQIKAFLKTYFDGIYSILALGETSATAYRGDRGKTAYDHSQAAHAPSDADNTVTYLSGIAAQQMGETDSIIIISSGAVYQTTYEQLAAVIKDIGDKLYQPL